MYNQWPPIGGLSHRKVGQAMVPLRVGSVLMPTRFLFVRLGVTPQGAEVIEEMLGESIPVLLAAELVKYAQRGWRRQLNLQLAELPAVRQRNVVDCLLEIETVRFQDTRVWLERDIGIRADQPDIGRFIEHAGLTIPEWFATQVSVIAITSSDGVAYQEALTRAFESWQFFGTPTGAEAMAELLAKHWTGRLASHP